MTITSDASSSNVARAVGGVDPGVLVGFDAVSVRYGEVEAIRSVSLAVGAQVSIALVGSNGSGKSTVLGLLAGLITPSDGVVTRRAGLRVAFVAQQHSHHRWMPLSVFEVIAMGRFGRRGLLRPLRRSDRQAIVAAAERLEVADLLRRSIGELSGGQRQRVLVARAVVDAPDLILLDEPITGLDLASQIVITRMMAAERDRGATVVFSTHHLDEARQADRVILLAGALVADGSPEQVLTPELLTAAFGGRLISVDGAVVVDEHGHGVRHDDCDHPDPGSRPIAPL